MTKPTDRSDEVPVELSPTTPLSNSEAEVGRSTIGRYTIRRVLGRGGMGVVVAAHDPELDRLVAVKILVDHGARGEILGAALRREAQALARVTHPNVLSVYDAGIDGSPYLVMQLVDGETLGAHLKRTKPPPDQIIALFLQAARGLTAIHAAGLIHRDVKPSNILVDKKGVVHVADLGLARIGELAQGGGASGPLTQTNTIAGTPAYMAPEQFERRELTPACDQFSFCVSLWEALAGERPFRGGSEEEIEKAVRDAPPSGRIEGISKSQLLALRRGLSSEPTARFPSMDALAAALGGSASRTPLLVVGGLTLAGGAAIAGALGLVASTSSSSTSRPDAAVAVSAKPKQSTLDLADVRRLTLTESCDEYPSIAPDGVIYYDAIFGADQHLMAYDPKTREARELTQTKGWDLSPEASPDGKRIVWLRKTDDVMAAHVSDIADLGDPTKARKVVPGGFRPMWSPDGRSVWAGSRKGLSRYDAETLTVNRTLALPSGAFPMAALEFADHRVVVLTKNGSATADGLYIYDKGDSNPRALIPFSEDNTLEEVLELAPDGSGVLIARLMPTNNVEIWNVPLDGSPSFAVSGAGIDAHKHLAIAGKRIVWSDCTEILTLATLSLTPTGTTKYTDLSRNNWADFSPVAIPNTDDILVLSYRSTNDEIWRMSKTGDRPRVVPFGKLQLDRIAVSQDGTWVVGSDDSGVYAGPIDGSGEPTKVHDGDDSEQNAEFSRDGRSIFLELREGKQDRIAMMARTGGPTTWVTPLGAMAPAVSPTDDVLAYLADVVVPGKSLQRVITLLDLKTKKTRQLDVAPYPYRYLRWSPDGKRLLAIRRDGRLAEVEVATSKIVRTFDVGADQLYGVTYVGDEIMVGHSFSAGDIWEGTLR